MSVGPVGRPRGRPGFRHARGQGGWVRACARLHPFRAPCEGPQAGAATVTAPRLRARPEPPGFGGDFSFLEG